MKLLIIISLLVSIIEPGFSLRNVRVAVPTPVPEGGVASLLCLYELQGEPLYSVKWYRGNHEIYRFLPREKPRIKVFPLPGLFIDINLSNAHRLTLIDVPKHLGGNFTCEVSADAPSYTTKFVTEFLQVIPKRNPSQFDEDISHEDLHEISANIIEIKNSSNRVVCCIYKYFVVVSFLLSFLINKLN